jgi:hypothetical protein
MARNQVVYPHGARDLARYGGAAKLLAAPTPGVTKAVETINLARAQE